MRALRPLRLGGLLRQRRTFSSQADFGFQDVDAKEKERLVKEVFSKVAEKYDLMNDCMSLGMHRLWKDYFVSSAGIHTAARVDPTVIPRHLDVAGGTGDIAFRMVDLMARVYKDEFSRLVDSPQISDKPPADRQIVVCDINPDMLKVGRSRAEGAVGMRNSKVLGFVEGNAEELPFPPNSFDLYTIAFGLRNVTDKDKALADAYRVLRKGGRLMVLEFSHVDFAPMQYLYDTYSFNIIPRMGQAIANDAASYQYLVESIRRFPKQEELKKMIESAGFRCVTYENLQFGIVSIHSGFKL